MNNRFLIASLALNVGLAVAVASLFKGPSPAPVFQTTEQPTPGEQPERRVPVRRAAAREDASAETSGPKQLQWRDVESAEYKTYIANLRAIECPEQTIRDIITAELNKKTANKRASIRQGGQFVYWKPDEEFNDYYPKLRQERALELEKRALLEELLGFDPNAEARREAGVYEYMEWQYDFLTGDKRTKARDLQEKYVDLAREAKSDGSPEGRQKARDLYDQRLVELAKVLTPEEVEEYDLRSSSLSENMRYSLDGFDPTPDEFRKIYRIKKAQEGNAETGNVEDAIRTVLGDERYADYRRAHDHSFKELYRMAKARDLPVDTADKVYDIKKLTEETIRNIRADSTLSPQQKTESIRQTSTDALQTIGQLVGEKNLAVYRTRGGWWLQQLGR